MKKIIMFVFCAVMAVAMHAQTVTGSVIDADSKEPLIGVSVLEIGTTNGVITDFDGNFELKVQVGAKLQLSYVGYETQEVVVNKHAHLGVIELKPEAVGLEDVTITGQIAVQRKTPIAVSQVTALEIEERLGGGEFVEVLKNTPGVHANAQGGGWGDSEIYMRGFDNTNIAMMINGVPMNGMENGKVYWSNWQGLSDVTSVMQTQRGLGASKMSAPSVGGTINIVTKGLDAKRGGTFSYAMGDNGYNKVTFSVSTGLLENGWAITVMGAKTWGEGYVQGTSFEGYNYFANISKRINENHQLSLTGFGAPQEHYQRSGGLTMAGWNEVKKYMKDGMHFSRYNSTYGYDNYGNENSANYNVYHKPQISLNHIWQIDHKSSLSTTAYVSLGRGYGRTAEPGYNSSYSYTDLTYGANYGTLSHTFRRQDGTFDYGAVEWANDPNNPIYDPNSDQYEKLYAGSQLVICENRNDHNWYGLTSTYTNKFADMFDFYAGIDVRYYQGKHNATISDLMGGEYFIDATRAKVKAANNAAALDPAWATEKLTIGDIAYRNYDGFVVQEGAFAQVEYNQNNVSAFLNASLNYNHYWKVDYFYYDAEHGKSDVLGFLGGTIKAGANYAFNENHNAFVNVGFISRAPNLDYGAFMNASTSNTINQDAKNEKVASAEVGYGFHNKYVNVAVNGYYTEWMDKAMTKSSTLSDPAQTEYFMNMTGVKARHMGIEFEVKARPAKWVELSAMLSLGDWQWDSDSVKGYIYDKHGQALTMDAQVTEPGAENHAWALINMKGIKVGGSAQTTANLGVTFKPFKGFRAGAEYTLYDRNYAYYSFSGSNLQLGKEMNLLQPWRIPTGGCLDLRASYSFPIGKVNATISGNVNNVLNQIYIEKAWNPETVSQTIKEVNADNVYFFFSKGTTYNVRLKINF
jgi:outer membrane cobalamin receptor